MDSLWISLSEKFRSGISAVLPFGYLYGWPQLFRPLPIELAPDLVGRFADPGLFDQFPCHCRHQILVSIERLEALA